METDLQRLHEVELEILLEFKNICEKHNLSYYLVAGTLLGAVRHNGFIPWDDDVDVAMPRKDYELFCNIYSQELSDDYFLQTRETDQEYFMGIAKIRKNGTYVCEPKVEHLNIHKGVFIDIFPIDKCPTNNILARFCFRIQYLLNTSIEIQKGIPAKYLGNNKIYKFVFFTFSKFNLHSLYKFQSILLKFLQTISDEKYICTIFGRHGYPAECYEANWFEKAELIFENNLFTVPKEWDLVLTQMYGDYKKIPEYRERHITMFELGKGEYYK